MAMAFWTSPTANGGSNNVTVLLGNGSGGFMAAPGTGRQLHFLCGFATLEFLDPLGGSGGISSGPFGPIKI